MNPLDANKLHSCALGVANVAEHLRAFSSAMQALPNYRRTELAEMYTHLESIRTTLYQLYNAESSHV